ncbi:MAG TPA: DUF4920 domain-containing protein [Pyrinomonadaceae bacterium]|nr:DUF4920 domain-containing protein [Pyrinomonadaceae bacterium]
MKTLFAALALAAALSLGTAAQDSKQHTHADKHADKHGQKGAHAEQHGDEAGETQTAAEALREGNGRIRRGAAIGKSPVVAFTDVLKEPKKFADRAVVVEGVVERVCQAKGCWVQIVPEAGATESVRVTFDHKFFVPKDADRMRFRAEGKFGVKYLTEDEATHLEGEGARLRRDKDGEATELTFLATGVELWK